MNIPLFFALVLIGLLLLAIVIYLGKVVDLLYIIAKHHNYVDATNTMGRDK